MNLAGAWFRHFKGTNYKVLSEATHSETSEDMVIYHSQDDPNHLWVRPKDMFLERLGNGLQRFEPIPFDSDGPIDPITIEYRKEHAAIAIQVMEGDVEIDFSPITKRGDLREYPPRLCHFSVEIRRGRVSHVPDGFFQGAFDIRVYGPNPMVLRDCQTTDPGPFSLKGTFDSRASFAELGPARSTLPSQDTDV